MTDARSDWQRRYDESMARERERAAADPVTAADMVSVAGGCVPMPLCVGLVVVTFTVVIGLVRRLIRSQQPNLPN
jgi:hypothetical protein